MTYKYKKLSEDNFDEYLLKVYSSWLGKVIGVRLGAPVESWSYEQIKEKYGEIAGYVKDNDSYPIFAADDDTNGPLFFVRSLLEKTKVTPEDIGNTFLNYIQEYSGFFWWGGIGVSSEHTAYENLKNGIKAPLSGSKETNGIEIAEQIGGQIFSDCWGYVAGYDPNLAKDLARKAASVTHDENGLEGATFVAVAITLAMQRNDIREVIDETLTFLDADKEYYQVMKDIINYYDNNHGDWHNCFEYIRSNYGYDKYPGVCHIIPNSAIMMMSMLYGENNYNKTIYMLCQCGWDTDCTCGNVGSIMGSLVGVDNIDEQLILPNNDIVNASSCVGSLNIQTISESAYMFASLAMKLKGLPQQEIKHFSLPYATEGFFYKKENGVYRAEKYVYYLPKDLIDARYDPAFSPIIYPGNILGFKVKANNAVIKIEIVDCEGNSFQSEENNVNGEVWISCQIPTSLNMVINKVGILSDQPFALLDWHYTFDSEIDYDFTNWKYDVYGPRWGGDNLINIRAFVAHSGTWKISEKGLEGSCKEQALITSGNISEQFKSCSISFEKEDKDRFGFIFGYQGYMNYYEVELYQDEIKILKKDNEIECLFTKKIVPPTFGKNSLKLYLDNDKICIIINQEVLEARAFKQNPCGGYGFYLEDISSVTISDFKLGHANLK